ncbi:MAG: hypothetical protein WCS88_03420 [Patescibacteria group bacterium]|jgi:hypothetical protein
MLFHREVTVRGIDVNEAKVIGLYYNGIQVLCEQDIFKLIVRGEERLSTEKISEVLEALDDQDLPEGLNLLSKTTFAEKTTVLFGLISPKVEEIRAIFPSFEITGQ